MFGFRKYIAPRSIQILWGLALAFGILGFIIALVSLFAPIPTEIKTVSGPYLLIIPIYLFFMRLGFEAYHAIFRTRAEVTELLQIARITHAPAPVVNVSAPAPARQPEPAPQVPAFVQDFNPASAPPPYSPPAPIGAPAPGGYAPPRPPQPAPVVEPDPAEGLPPVQW